MNRRPLNAGERFGLLVALERVAEPRSRKYPEWVCRCDCGAVKTVLQQSLRSGGSTSCGCVSTEKFLQRNITHGMTKTGEYRIWIGIRRRCYTPSAREYRWYGGRGIKICERWDSFENFYADMGPRPSKQHSVDRIDNDGPYSPENCRWATRVQQARNKSTSVRVKFKGRVMTAVEWSRELQLHPETVRKRAHIGMPLDLPPDRRGNRGKRGQVEVL